jgi:hypothetical protein
MVEKNDIRRRKNGEGVRGMLFEHFLDAFWWNRVSADLLEFTRFLVELEELDRVLFLLVRGIARCVQLLYCLKFAIIMTSVMTSDTSMIMIKMKLVLRFDFCAGVSRPVRYRGMGCIYRSIDLIFGAGLV